MLDARHSNWINDSSPAAFFFISKVPSPLCTLSATCLGESRYEPPSSCVKLPTILAQRSKLGGDFDSRASILKGRKRCRRTARRQNGSCQETGQDIEFAANARNSETIGADFE